MGFENAKCKLFLCKTDRLNLKIEQTWLDFSFVFYSLRFYSKMSFSFSLLFLCNELLREPFLA